jgi:MerR family transcriptional regulator, redox-sensitive transcriptional activator SoxR
VIDTSPDVPSALKGTSSQAPGGKLDGTRLTIGEVARRCGLATSTIRYYERIGLLPPPYRESGQRRYEDDVLGTLSLIGVAQQAGFTLREIGELLARIEQDAVMAAPMRALSARKLPEIEALIERAEAMRGWLAAASECTCPTPAECALFPAEGDGQAPEAALTVHLVEGKGCLRAPAAG